MNVRKIASIRKITDVTPIPDADRIELAHVGGWGVVVPKGLYVTGEDVIYCEVDAALPLNDPRFAPLTKGMTTKNLGGNDYAIVKTKRIRGVISQGVILKLSDFPEVEGHQGEIKELIGVVRYASETKGNTIGDFPHKYAVKSDAERIQNLNEFLSNQQSRSDVWEPTEKLDGQSVTIGKDEHGDVFVASRNHMVTTEGHPVITMMNENGWDIDPGWAIQGELVGPGIQSNPLKLAEKEFHVFQVFHKAHIVPVAQWPQWAQDNRVPVLDIPFPTTVDEAVQQATFDSTINDVEPEGIVWMDTTGTLHPELGHRSVFKAINNNTL